MGFLLRVNFITKVVDVAGKHPGQAVNTVHSWVEEKALWPTPAPRELSNRGSRRRGGP